jgi:hypothetical protein
MALSDKIGSVPAPKQKIVRGRSAIFPIAIPEIPASVFPIISQEDLVTKISRLFLAPPFLKTGKPGTPLPVGVDVQKNSGKRAEEK